MGRRQPLPPSPCRRPLFFWACYALRTERKNNEIDYHEPTFKYNWHAKAWAITLAAGALGEWNLDISRHYRECLPPKDYMNYSYYEKWLAALTNLLVDKNLVSLEELKSVIDLVEKKGLNFEANKSEKLDKRAWLAKDVQKTLGWGGPSIREINVSPIIKPFVPLFTAQKM